MGRAVRAAKAPAIASNSAHIHGQGGLRAALFRGPRKLAFEALVIFALIGIGALVAYKVGVHKVVNPRPLAGANVDVSPVEGSQTQAAFAVDPAHPDVLFGVDEALAVHVSTTAGRTWQPSRYYQALTGLCTHRDPRVAIDGTGREYVAFVASDICTDELQPYVLVASRAGLGRPWQLSRPARHRTWEFGFDDQPSLAVDDRSGRVYVAWTRSLGPHVETVVVSRSADHGRSWSTPLPVADPASHPHLARVAVAPNGDVYVAGIDKDHGIWAVRSTDGGRTFTRPAQLAPLLANPADDCARTGNVPVANESRTCAGPNPTLLATRSRVLVVYSDYAANRTQDVIVGAADPALHPLFRRRVGPPDVGKAQQLLPVAAADPADGLLWACWYDTAYYPHGTQAWFTCAHSAEGRRWSAPVRASSVPTPLDYLFVYQGLQPGLTADRGVAHAFWLDGRRVNDLNDIFTAAIPHQR